MISYIFGQRFVIPLPMSGDFYVSCNDTKDTDNQALKQPAPGQQYLVQLANNIGEEILMIQKDQKKLRNELKKAFFEFKARPLLLEEAKNRHRELKDHRRFRLQKMEKYVQEQMNNNLDLKDALSNVKKVIEVNNPTKFKSDMTKKPKCILLMLFLFFKGQIKNNKIYDALNDVLSCLPELRQEEFFEYKLNHDGLSPIEWHNLGEGEKNRFICKLLNDNGCRGSYFAGEGNEFTKNNIRGINLLLGTSTHFSIRSIKHLFDKGGIIFRLQRHCGEGVVTNIPGEVIFEYHNPLVNDVLEAFYNYKKNGILGKIKSYQTRSTVTKSDNFGRSIKKWCKSYCEFHVAMNNARSVMNFAMEPILCFRSKSKKDENLFTNNECIDIWLNEITGDFEKYFTTSLGNFVREKNQKYQASIEKMVKKALQDPTLKDALKNYYERCKTIYKTCMANANINNDELPILFSFLINKIWHHNTGNQNSKMVLEFTNDDKEDIVHIATLIRQKTTHSITNIINSANNFVKTRKFYELEQATSQFFEEFQKVRRTMLDVRSDDESLLHRKLKEIEEQYDKTIADFKCMEKADKKDCLRLSMQPNPQYCHQISPNNFKKNIKLLEALLKDKKYNVYFYSRYNTYNRDRSLKQQLSHLIVTISCESTGKLVKFGDGLRAIMQHQNLNPEEILPQEKKMGCDVKGRSMGVGQICGLCFFVLGSAAFSITMIKKVMILLVCKKIMSYGRRALNKALSLGKKHLVFRGV